MNRRQFTAALVVGAAIRAATLTLPGTRDVAVWKIWMYNAARHSPARLYGVGGSPPERRVLLFHGADTTVDYPPLTLYELAGAGRVYRLLRPSFPDDEALVAAIKILLLAFETGFLVLAYRIVGARAGIAAARWSVVAYWLNPAPLFDAGILCYLDPLFVLPLVASLLAASGGWLLAAGLLFGCAVATKAQALVAAPALALAVWNGGPAGGRPRRFAVAAAGAVAALGSVVAPVAKAGALGNLRAALESLTRHDMLSGNAPNLWWLVGYWLRAWYSMADLGAWRAFTMPTRILAISRTIEIGYPNPRIVGSVLTLAAMAWALWTARRAADRFLIVAVGAFLVHAYATLAAQVHENHLFAAVPLLLVAAAVRPRLRPVMWTLSAIFAVNLNLFYGISEVHRGMGGAADAHGHRPVGRARRRQLRDAGVARVRAQRRMLHGSRTAPTASPSVEPSTGSAPTTRQCSSPPLTNS